MSGHAFAARGEQHICTCPSAIERILYISRHSTCARGKGRARTQNILFDNTYLDLDADTNMRCKISAISPEYEPCTTYQSAPRVEVQAARWHGHANLPQPSPWEEAVWRGGGGDTAPGAVVDEELRLSLKNLHEKMDMLVSVSSHVHAHIQTYTHTQTHTYTHTHTRIHIHKHAHTLTQKHIVQLSTEYLVMFMIESLAALFSCHF